MLCGTSNRIRSWVGTAKGSGCFGVGNPSRWERPRLPKDLRQLIREMAADNATWGEERIANELKLKLAIRVSLRTVGKYLRTGATGAPARSEPTLADLRPQSCQGDGGL